MQQVLGGLRMPSTKQNPLSLESRFEIRSAKLDRDHLLTND